MSNHNPPKDAKGKELASGQLVTASLVFPFGEIVMKGKITEIDLASKGRIHVDIGGSTIALMPRHSDWLTAADGGGDNPPGGPPNGGKH